MSVESDAELFSAKQICFVENAAIGFDILCSG